MKRNVVNKADLIECQICHEMVSSYGFTNHIKFNKDHRDYWPIEKYINAFGEYRKNQTPIKGERIIPKIQCMIPGCGQICSAVGMFTHLRDSHDDMSPDEYVNLGYPEYRTSKIEYNNREEIPELICLICGRVHFVSDREFTYHIKLEHNLPMEEYALKFVFNNQIPKCECGCGEQVTILTTYPFRSRFISGHSGKGENNGMFGRIHSPETSKKMSVKAVARKGREGISRNSKPEKKFKIFLDQNNIKYEFQEPTIYGRIDFYLPEYELYVEIDGEYWHPIVYERLNLQLVQSMISQKKRDGMTNLIRIRENDLDKIQSIEDLYKFNFEYDFSLNYYQPIVHKSLFPNLNEDEKKKSIYLLMNVIRGYQPDFPDIPTYENLSKIINAISNYDFSRILKEKTFSNNCWSIGNSYLKSNFKSYWNSSYKGSKTPVEAWKDEKLMRSIIKYRTGQNNSGEVFDFSLHQMVRGLSANRITISFFKPLMAAAIYKNFLGDLDTPIVLDPCAGFGGRMLGFKSLYPNGTYIGVEPNIDTFNELLELSKNFSNVELHNCKIEDFKLNTLVDLTFTSIPYYDVETYSKPTTYNSIEIWKTEFLEKVKSLPNLVLNIPQNLRNDFDDCVEYFISSNTSHFNKSTNKKLEYLLDFRK